MSFFNHYQGTFIHLLRNPSILKLSAVYETIEIRCLDYNLVCDAEMLLNFIANCGLEQCRQIKLNLNGSNGQATTGARLVEEFWEHPNPETMIKQIYHAGRDFGVLLGFRSVHSYLGIYSKVAKFFRNWEGFYGSMG